MQGRKLFVICLEMSWRGKV